MGSVPPECSWRSDRLPPAHTVRRVVVRASSIPPRSDETSMRRGSGCTAGGAARGYWNPLATEVPIAPWWPRGLMQPNREPELIVAPPEMAEKGNDSGQRMDSSPPPATPSIQEQVQAKVQVSYSRKRLFIREPRWKKTHLTLTCVSQRMRAKRALPGCARSALPGAKRRLRTDSNTTQRAKRQNNTITNKPNALKPLECCSTNLASVAGSASSDPLRLQFPWLAQCDACRDV